MYLAGMDYYDIMRVTGHTSPAMLKKYIKADSIEVLPRLLTSTVTLTKHVASAFPVHEKRPFHGREMILNTLDSSPRSLIQVASKPWNTGRSNIEDELVIYVFQGLS